MKNLLLIICMILLVSNGYAESIKISSELTLDFTVPEGWQWAQQPPQQLLEEMADHIGHDAAAKGHTPARDQLLESAKKRMLENEVILYNPETLAHITLDFSRLGQREKAPSKKTIKLSAKYAGQSLAQEEEVSQLKGKESEFHLRGAWYAYRYDADFLKHGSEVHFAGIIGFVSPYWVFFYATDPLKAATDAAKIEQVFESLQISKASGS